MEELSHLVSAHLHDRDNSVVHKISETALHDARKVRFADAVANEQTEDLDRELLERELQNDEISNQLTDLLIRHDQILERLDQIERTIHDDAWVRRLKEQQGGQS